VDEYRNDCDGTNITLLNHPGERNAKNKEIVKSKTISHLMKKAEELKAFLDRSK